ncbi:MAG: chromate transporter [Candidatus Micrarchaeia archaeon]
MTLPKITRNKKALTVATIAIIIFLLLGSPVSINMGITFFKIGAFAFGNGYTAYSFIQKEIVETNQWLSINEFADGIALSQITPGPVLNVAAFVGYKQAGILGALMATIGVFAGPVFIMWAFLSEEKKLQDSPLVNAVFKALLAAFIGMIAFVMISIAQTTLFDPATNLLDYRKVTFAAFAAIALFHFKTKIAVLIVASAVLSLIVFGV